MVALRSVQRTQSRPGSAINRALSGGVLAPTPPNWGTGHMQTSVHAATSSRPATAGPSCGGSRPGTRGAIGGPLSARSGSGGSGGGGGAHWALDSTLFAPPLPSSPHQTSY
eukprot:364985-Chlamydomonas_euryale.AAC.4